MRNPFTLTAGVVACVGLASQVQASDFQVQGIVISDAVIQFPGSGPQFDFRQQNLAPIDFNDFGNPGPRPGSLVILESELSANRVTDVNGFGLTDVRNNAEVTIPNSQITGDVGMDQSAGVRGQDLGDIGSLPLDQLGGYSEVSQTIQLPTEITQLTNSMLSVNGAVDILAGPGAFGGFSYEIRDDNGVLASGGSMPFSTGQEQIDIVMMVDNTVGPVIIEITSFVGARYFGSPPPSGNDVAFGSIVFDLDYTVGIPAPGAVAIAGVAGLAAVRRRR